MLFYVINRVYLFCNIRKLDYKLLEKNWYYTVYIQMITFSYSLRFSNNLWAYIKLVVFRVNLLGISLRILIPSFWTLDSYLANPWPHPRLQEILKRLFRYVIFDSKSLYWYINYAFAKVDFKETILLTHHLGRLTWRSLRLKSSRPYGQVANAHLPFRNPNGHPLKLKRF